MARQVKLTPKASLDFENIIEFGIERFGPRQTYGYADGLIEFFDRIAERPLHHQRVGRYRRATYHAHAIYYLVMDDLLIIARINGASGFTRSLP